MTTPPNLAAAGNGAIPLVFHIKRLTAPYLSRIVGRHSAPCDMRALSAKTIYALATTPLLWVACFYLYVIRQRLHLGFWPRPCQPDPKDAGYMIHHLSIYLGVLLIPLLGIAVMGFIIHRRVADASFRWLLAIVLLAFSFACFIAVMYLDPGDYWVWFLD